MLSKIHAKLIEHAPSLLGRPLNIVPFSIKKTILEQAMNWQFIQAIKEGELDFLQGKWLKIQVHDLNLTWFITLRDSKLVISQFEQEDVSFSGNTNDLILAMARKVDPDTLFFQRKLLVEGDTELGLYIKNLIAGLDFETIPYPLKKALLQLADFIQTGLHYVENTTNLAMTPPVLK